MLIKIISSKKCLYRINYSFIHTLCSEVIASQILLNGKQIYIGSSSVTHKFIHFIFIIENQLVIIKEPIKYVDFQYVIYKTTCQFKLLR